MWLYVSWPDRGKIRYPVSSYLLFIELPNDRKGLFDVKSYLDKGIFTELKD